MGLLSFPAWVYPVGGIVLLFIFLPRIGWVAGLIVIGEREVGIITKKFSSRNLPAGRLIALNGEAGLQADTLPPAGISVIFLAVQCKKRACGYDSAG